jgi:hypothetical protein
VAGGGLSKQRGCGARYPEMRACDKYLEKKSETEKREKKGDHRIDRDTVLLPIHHRDIVLFIR